MISRPGPRVISPEYLVEMNTITVAKGDGIGPEIMDATLAILKAAHPGLAYEEIQIGEQVYLQGNTSGIAPEAWDSIRRNRVLLKSPITTPQGGGYKSLNVTMRKSLGLFANVRPCRSYAPFVTTKHPELDIVVIRENEEDLYAGIEHQQTDEVVQCLKLITRPGCEQIVRYAFEYAKKNGRKRVTCMTKDNIMKQTDGLFHAVFNEIAAEHPDIESNHWIVDIGTALVADRPEAFDVIVIPNLYGDILSDVTAQIAGSVGLAGSANIGRSCAMFEAIHGSAPDLAGKDAANPSGLIQAAVMMLNHLGESESATQIQNAWLRTIEDGVHTADVYDPATSTACVGTRAFAEAVIARLGQRPERFTPATYAGNSAVEIAPYVRKARKRKTWVGVDVFVDWPGDRPDELARQLQAAAPDGMELVMVTNRGVKVWPQGFEETFLTDHWRCRFQPQAPRGAGPAIIPELLAGQLAAGLDCVKTENLYEFDGVKGYSLGQGQ